MTKRRISLHDNHLQVECEFNEEIRLVLRSLPGARWDRTRSAWLIPRANAQTLLSQLEPFGFAVEPGLRLTADQDDTASDKTLSVRQLNWHISRTLQQNLEQGIWVRGEVSNHDKNINRKHLYFELIEKGHGGDAVAAKIAMVIFAKQRLAIRRRLQRATEPVTLRDGLEVRVRGRVDFYSPTGRLQFIVDDIDPEFALGQLALRRAEIIEQLRVEGILRTNVERPFPRLPQRIGLITADQSDALHDVLRSLEQSPYGFEVIHHPVAVQGAALQATVMRALTYFYRRRPAVDLVLIVRGGGSRSDLAWFDNLRVAQAVARYPIKILVGIGHERDRSVLDEIALSAKTPTAAAEIIASTVARTESELLALAERFGNQVQRRLMIARQQISSIRARLLSRATRGVDHARFYVDSRLSSRIRERVWSQLATERARLGRFDTRLSPSWIRQRLEVQRVTLDDFGRRLLLAGRRAVRQARQDVALLTVRTEAVDPQRTLSRGFALVRDARGRVVRSAREVSKGSLLDIRLADGRVEAEVVGSSRGPARATVPGSDQVASGRNRTTDDE